jgi:hypothetical protein
MRDLVGAFALLMPLALAGMETGRAADGDAACSRATLQGTYLFAFDGVRIEGDARSPFAVAGYEVYDGDGGMRSIVTTSAAGRVSRNVRTTGTYAVEADCTGTVAYSDGTRYDLFVAPDGSSFVFIQTNPGTVASGFEPRATARRIGD